MTFVNKNGTAIINELPTYYDENENKFKLTEEAKDYFNCDELIAPVILLLNKFGYKTKFCCSGHIVNRKRYKEIDSTVQDYQVVVDDGEYTVLPAYISFEEDEKIDFEKPIGGWYKKYVITLLDENDEPCGCIETDENVPDKDISVFNYSKSVVLRNDLRCVTSKIGETSSETELIAKFNHRLADLYSDMVDWIHGLPTIKNED